MRISSKHDPVHVILLTCERVEGNFCSIKVKTANAMVDFIADYDVTSCLGSGSCWNPQALNRTLSSED
jgi:hypothetical protein